MYQKEWNKHQCKASVSLNFMKTGCKFEINTVDLPSSAKLPNATRHISVRAAFWQ